MAALRSEKKAGPPPPDLALAQMLPPRPRERLPIPLKLTQILSEMEGENRRMLQQKGALNEEQRSAYEKARKASEKLQTAIAARVAPPR